jgi:hypothetical protein
MEKYEYILVEYRDFGYGKNIPLKYFPKKKRRGKLSTYKPEYAKVALICCRDLGATFENLAKIFSTTRNTIYRWLSQQPEFEEAIRNGTDFYDKHRVEKTLIARALGMEYEEVKEETVKVLDKYANKAIIPATKITRTKKFVPGDPSCLFFYLQNRDSNRWKNTKYLQLSGEIQTKNETTVKMEQLRKMDKQDLFKLKEIYEKAKIPLKRSLEV